MALVHRAHGLGGETSVELVGDNPRRLDPGSRLTLTRPDATSSIPETVEVERSRRAGGRYLVKFREVSGREEAAALGGSTLSISRDAARPAEGQVWVGDLVGLEVVGADGRAYGRVRDVLDYPAQDILEIDTEKGIRHLPYVSAFIAETSLADGKIVVIPPEGVFD